MVLLYPKATCSNMVLIPKVQNPRKFAELKPISVSNFCYKIIARVMLDHLNKCLHKLIAPEQAGFVPDRSIHDNIALAIELTHDLNKKTRGGNVIIQVDMEKDYDRVEWGFLLNVLKAMGFSTRWCELVGQCIRNCWYTVKLKGISKGFFRSTRVCVKGTLSLCLIHTFTASFFGLHSEFVPNKVHQTLPSHKC